MTANKKTPTDSLQADETQVQLLFARRQALAKELHGCTSRVEAQRLLADVFAADRATQMALLKTLARTRDSAAADLLLAAHELAPLKEVRKEARRGLIQLAGAKVYPSWTPEPEPAAVGGVAVENAPRFWKGLVAEMREAGELQLTLCWEYGVEYSEARMMSFLLDFWREGVKDFFTDTGTKRYIEDRLKEMRQRTRMAETEAGDEEHATYVDCTLAEGRRLLNEALDVNRWRKTEPHKDFRQALPLVQRLVLHAGEVGEDRGLTFISRGLEPDMVAANFAGAWAMGDYGLCYDLLTRDSPLLEGHSRAEWIELRRRWADEAHPMRFELYFLTEREQSSQSGLWLPTSVLSARAAGSKEIEMSWSLQLADTPLSGTLPEMPLGTTVYKETGRHWFWTVYVVEQQQGEWRLARIRDEGAAIQALPLDELQRRVQENDEAIQKIMREHQPSEPDAQKYFDEIVRRSWQILSLDDARLVRNPLDKAIYEDAYGRAMSLRAVERAAVYAEELVRRFPNDPDHLSTRQRLGAVQVALAERFGSLGLNEQARHFMELGEATLRDTLSTHDPLSYVLVAELLVSQGKEEDAEKLLLEAREFAQERDAQAQIEFDLAHIAVNQERFADAQRYLERLAEISPNYPSLWAMLGYAQREQGNFAEAEIAFKRSMEEDPTEVRAYAELGTLYVDRNELDKARDVFSQGIRALPQSAHLRALMAMVYIEKGDQRRAREYLQEAERLNPDLEIVQAIRELLKKK
jgi:tetratricopeptide (TPR) repeat protein